MLKKCIKIISVFLCAVLIFQSLEVGIFATVEQPDETDGENEIFCPCENCSEYECSCECENEEECNCIQCKRTAYSEYDEFGNVIAEKSFDGTKTMTAESYVYSEDGELLLSSTDSSGNTAYYTYNEAGLVETVSAGSSSGTATYDEAGNLLSFSQNVSGLSDGNVMSNSYTYEDDKVKTITHNGFSYVFNYDERGNQTKTQIGNIVFVENTYETVEDVDRLTDTSFINGQNVSYEYDEAGNITGVSYDGTERYSYTYDEEGILQSETDNLSGITTVYTENGTELRETDSNTLLYSSYFDENGNEVHNVSGSSVTYNSDSSYNAGTGEYTDILSFEKEATVTGDGVTSVFANEADISVNTDWFGRVTSKNIALETAKDDVASAVNSSTVYNYADTDTTATTKITSMTSSFICGENTFSQQEYYEYDAVGNITGIYRIEENEKVYYNRYYYDEANQIIREDNRLGEFSCTYTYDVGGNIVSRIIYPYTEGDLTGLTSEETHTYSYNNSVCGDVLTGYDGQSVSYDNMGNITYLDGMEYTWTAGRQLSRMRDIADGSYVEYLYNSDGQMYCLRMLDENDEIEGEIYYFWDDTKLTAMELVEYSKDENGNVVTTEALRSRVIYDSEGEPLGYLLNDAMPLLYTKNILGDITGLVDGTTGQLLFNYVYDAYGNLDIKTPNGSLGEAIGAMIVLITNPLSYRGYLYAPMAGYSYYLGSRFYTPTLCRFMNADVYADTAQGVVATNMFAYCNNNPVMFVDPNGTDAFSDLFGVFNKVVTTVITLFNTLIGNGGRAQSSATQISTDQNIPAIISTKNEIDWFKVKVKSQGAYNIYTEGDVDTKIEIYQKKLFGKYKLLASNDNSGAYLNAYIKFGASNNINYYIKVSTKNNDTGYYVLKVETNVDKLYSPTGGSWQWATSIPDPDGSYYNVDKIVYLPIEEIDGYYKLLRSNSIKQLRDKVISLTYDAAVAFIMAQFDIGGAVAPFVVDLLLSEFTPNLTDLELDAIERAGRMNDDGKFTCGVKITSNTLIRTTSSGNTFPVTNNIYESWTDDYIYGEPLYRGKFDINDKKPLWR